MSVPRYLPSQGGLWALWIHGILHISVIVDEGKERAGDCMLISPVFTTFK
jgi:hypothetical protein